MSLEGETTYFRRCASCRAQSAELRDRHHIADKATRVSTRTQSVMADGSPTYLVGVWVFGCQIARRGQRRKHALYPMGWLGGGEKTEDQDLQGLMDGRKSVTILGWIAKMDNAGQAAWGGHLFGPTNPSPFSDPPNLTSCVPVHSSPFPIPRI